VDQRFGRPQHVARSIVYDLQKLMVQEKELNEPRRTSFDEHWRPTAGAAPASDRFFMGSSMRDNTDDGLPAGSGERAQEEKVSPARNTLHPLSSPLASSPFPPPSEAPLDTVYQ